MSLILEALKRLDREKESPDRGFLVVASSPWPAQGRRLHVALFGLAAVALGVGVAVGLGALRPRGVSVTPPVPPTAAVSIKPMATSAPAPTPSTTLSPSIPTSIAPVNAMPQRETLLPAPLRLGEGPPSPTAKRVLSASLPPLVLQAISERDGRPIALLSDRLVWEGDEFDGVRVVRIGEAEVEVEWKGRRSVIRF